MSTSIERLHTKARRAVEAGESKLREAAAYLVEARKLGATQRQSAKAIGKSPAWVNQLLRWADGGCEKTPFGPQSKMKRASRVQAPEQPQRAPTTAEQVAKYDFQKARAMAVAAMFGDARVSTHLRLQLIEALGRLPSEHPAERIRARLNMEWTDLIVAAAVAPDQRAA